MLCTSKAFPFFLLKAASFAILSYTAANATPLLFEIRSEVLLFNFTSSIWLDAKTFCMSLFSCSTRELCKYRILFVRQRRDPSLEQTNKQCSCSWNSFTNLSTEFWNLSDSIVAAAVCNICFHSYCRAVGRFKNLVRQVGIKGLLKNPGKKRMAFSSFALNPKLYIPSMLNIDLILWHTQSIVCAVKC